MKPGPGNYDPMTTGQKKNAPAYAIGTGTRKDLAFEKAKTFQTAPGQYDPVPETTKLRAAGWKIGTETRPSVVQKGQERMPGAGTYSIPSRVMEGPKISMSAITDKVD